MDLYREIILDHYKHPRNFGSLDKPDASFEAQNATCGDKIKIEVIFEEKNGQKRIKDVSFSGVGCAISQASASMLTEKIKGMVVEKIMKLKTEDIENLLGTKLTVSRVKCATLPLEVLQKLILK